MFVKQVASHWNQFLNTCALTLELRREESRCDAVCAAVSSVSMSASVERSLRSCSLIMVSTHCVWRAISFSESCAGTTLFVRSMHGANTMASALEFIRFTSSCSATLQKTKFYVIFASYVSLALVRADKLQ